VIQATEKLYEFFLGYGKRLSNSALQYGHQLHEPYTMVEWVGALA
jgi:hypothetical protein